MELQDAHPLSNNFQNVRLFRLHSAPSPGTEEPGRDSLANPASALGPYVLMQTAVDPEDYRGEIDDFILGRSGRWLPYYLFHQLPVEQREEEFHFASAAEAIAMLESLPGKPEIDRLRPPPSGSMQDLPPPEIT